jgi:anthranilate phosphoribosyltransferase
VRRQVIGVADPRFVEPMAQTLQRQGLEHAWVVHGAGLDELTTTGPSTCSRSSTVRSRVHDRPGAARAAAATADDLRGGDPDENAAVIRRVLGGELGPHRDIVVLNAAAGLVVGGAVVDIAAGIEVAAAAIDDGRAQGALDALVRVSQAQAE